MGRPEQIKRSFSFRQVSGSVFTLIQLMGFSLTYFLLANCSKVISVPKLIGLLWPKAFRLAPKANNRQRFVDIFIWLFCL